MCQGSEIMRWRRHERWARSVEALVDGELSDSSGDVVLEHLHRCAECSRHAGLIMDIRRPLRRAAIRVQPPPTRRLLRLVGLPRRAR